MAILLVGVYQLRRFFHAPLRIPFVPFVRDRGWHNGEAILVLTFTALLLSEGLFW